MSARAARLLLGVVSVGVCGGLSVLAEWVVRADTPGLWVHAALPSTLAELGRQNGAEDCGPAVLSFVLLAIGRDVTPAQVARLPESPPVPWSLLDLHRAADRLGLESQLLTLDRVRSPGWHVLHLPLEGKGGHFVAARRVSSGRLQIFDPARGELRLVKEAQLGQVWEGKALRIVGERLPRRGELPARRRVQHSVL